MGLAGTWRQAAPLGLFLLTRRPLCCLGLGAAGLERATRPPRAYTSSGSWGRGRPGPGPPRGAAGGPFLCCRTLPPIPGPSPRLACPRCGFLRERLVCLTRFSLTPSSPIGGKTALIGPESTEVAELLPCPTPAPGLSAQDQGRWGGWWEGRRWGLTPSARPLWAQRDAWVGHDLPGSN